MANATFDPCPLLAEELSIPLPGIRAVVELLGENATVPFIARYRKERTGNLDEVQIRNIEERHAYLMELEQRRATVLASIQEQGKLTPELEARILACATKVALEDLYLPFKPKRRTRAIIARERGLQPLADLISSQSLEGDPIAAATAYVNPELGVADVDAALQGAKDIVAEEISENAEVRALTRDVFMREGILVTTAVDKDANQRTKFEQYYDFREPVAQIPSHRFLAIRRGEREAILKAAIEVDEAQLLPTILHRLACNERSPFAALLVEATQDAFRRLLSGSIESEIRVDLKQRSDRDAVEVFANNLRALLLAPPLGMRAVIGIDPGLRTGCKCAATDHTGKYLDTLTIYPHTANPEKAKRELLAFVARFQPAAIAIGNGTAGRETESFVREALSSDYKGDACPMVVLVNEAGASVYSASPLAGEEFPDLDLTIRGAISIARRLQDPLAELVKIDPKSIGVGQYQHDVHQPLLKKKLEEVVESCVNHVGVELNTASAALLQYVAGIGPSLAKKIVTFRDECGTFSGRKSLLKVPSLGPKTFEQAAGFLRVKASDHPLDASAVHPERYAVVERMAKDLGVALGELIGHNHIIDKIDIERYVSADLGSATLQDIIAELRKPGRDPRKEFSAPQFQADVKELKDLSVGLLLEGVVTNVTHFGAFVDVGVHQDGLVHISQLADHYVSDPNTVVKVGDRVKVRVLEVDHERKRISLTRRLEVAPPKDAAKDGPAKETRSAKGNEGRRQGRSGRGDERGSKGHKDNLSYQDTQKFGHNPFEILRKR